MTHEKTTIQQIEAIIHWYYKLGTDFKDVDRLTNVVRRLPTLLFFFAGELGEAYRDKNATEYNRKSAFSKKEMELIKSGTSGVAAKSEATVFVDHLLNLEQTADALYKQTNLFYETANAVLEAMRQQVSTLKTEKSLEIKGGLQGAWKPDSQPLKNFFTTFLKPPTKKVGGFFVYCINVITFVTPIQ